MKVGVPTIAAAEAYNANSANTPNPNNILDMDIRLSMFHPCRLSTFTNQVVPAMSSIVGQGPDDYYISPFVHTRTQHPGSGGDCGTMTFTIFEDGAFPYPYSDFISVSSQSNSLDDFLV